MTKLSWDAADRDAVRRFHSPLFRRWKARRDAWSIVDIPGFVESLQALHDYGYSLTDIACTWGVTRERVRQWFEKYGLERHEEAASVRVWDDDLACFYPVSHPEYQRRRAAAIQRHRKHAKIAADIALVRRLAKKMGRPPAVADLTEEVYGDRNVPASGIAARWGWGRNADCTYAEAMDRLYDAAGIERPTRAQSQAYRRGKVA